MNGRDLNERMRTLRLSGAALARLTGLHPTTITRYRKPMAEVPKWLAVLMDVLANASMVLGMLDDARATGRRRD